MTNRFSPLLSESAVAKERTSGDDRPRFDRSEAQSTPDLSFVRELVRAFYAHEGRPSVDPVVFFKLQPVMFEDLRRELQLMRS